MKNINHTRSSISDDIRNILCSSANMRRAIPLILRLLMNYVNLSTNLASHFFDLVIGKILTSRLSLSKHLAHNLGNLLLLGKIGVFHNRRNASSRLLLLISKHLILCIYLVFSLPTAYDVYPLDGRHDGGYYTVKDCVTIDVLPRTPGNNVYVGFMVWSNFTATKCRGLVSLNQVIKEIICLQPLK